MANSFAKKRDPGRAEQKALEDYEKREQAKEPVTLRLVSPSAGVPSSRAAAGSPYPVAFPPPGMSDPGTTKEAFEWWDKARETAGNARDAWSLVSDPERMKNLQSGMGMAETAGKYWNKLKGFGGQAWGAIQKAFPAGLEWLKNRGNELSSDTRDFVDNLQPAIDAAKPAITVQDQMASTGAGAKVV